MDKNQNFLKTIMKAFNPWKYDELSERWTIDALKYFFSFQFIAFILMIVVSIPLLITLPGYINTQLDKFDTLEISIKSEMNGPIHLTDSDPTLLIDTRVPIYNFTEQPEEKYILTDKFLYVKKPFSRDYEQFTLGDYKNVKGNTGWYSNFFVWALILMIPSLLVIGYVIFAIKYMLLILLAALVGWAVCRLAKFDIGFIGLFKVGVYSITPAILLELIGMLFNFDQYMIHYLAFLIFFILGAIRSGKIEEVHHRRKRPKFKIGSKNKRGSEYIEL